MSTRSDFATGAAATGAMATGAMATGAAATGAVTELGTAVAGAPTADSPGMVVTSSDRLGLVEHAEHPAFDLAGPTTPFPPVSARGRRRSSGAS